MKHELWNLKVKEYNIVAYTQRFNELALMCLRMVDLERVKVDAYIWGLTDNIKGEVTSSRQANLNKVMRMAYKLMDQKSQAKDERIFEGKKRKWESFQSGTSSGKGNQMDNSCQTLQNNQRQGNTRAMVTTPTDGKLPLCERCFTCHVGQCMIKCHKCVKVGHKLIYCKEKNVATGANALPIMTFYDCSEQGHTRNRCLRKVKQEEDGEVHGRAYAIKDVEPKGPNVVTGTFLLNIHNACVLFDSGFDRSFMDTRFSFMLDIDPVKIRASYEVELADGRVLGMFGVIIGMDWLVKQDAVIVYGEKVIRIPYGNMMLIVKSDKDVSRLKVKSCIKAHSVQFLGHVIDRSGVHVDPAKIEAIKSWAAPTMPTEVKAEHQKPSGLLQQPEIPVWKWERIFFVRMEMKTPYAGLSWDSKLTGLEFICDMTEKIIQIKNHLLTACGRQKSYADKRAKPLEFEVGDMVNNLKILARVGPIAYTLELHEELKGIHSTFHVLNLKKCLAEGDIVVPMDEN
ncbi:hypothetical protein Tco_1203224 [Tanacetum coccineum]